MAHLEECEPSCPGHFHGLLQCVEIKQEDPQDLCKSPCEMHQVSVMLGPHSKKSFRDPKLAPAGSTPMSEKQGHL